MYVMERRSYLFFFFFCSWLGCVYVRLDVWVYDRVLCLDLAPVVRWVGARMPPGGALCGCCAGRRRGGGRAWFRGFPVLGVGRGARHLAAFIGRFRRRGFVGLGLGLCFAVVSAWRCLRGVFLAVAGPWFCGFPVLGLVGGRGLYSCVYACERMLIFCVLAGWRVVEADSIIPPSLFSQAAPLGAAAPLFLLIPPPFPGPRCLDVPLACPTSLLPLHGAASAGPSGNRLCLAGWARVLCGK